MLTLHDAGLRCGELVRLKVGNWRREPGNIGSYLLVYEPKTNTPRFAVLGKTGTEAMAAYMALRGETYSDDPLFCHERSTDRRQAPIKEKCVEAMLLRRAAKAGLERYRVHPHIWRKVFATAFADNGGDSDCVCSWDGSPQKWLRAMNSSLKCYRIRTSASGQWITRRCEM